MVGSCDYPIPEAPAGEHHVDLISIPASTQLDMHQLFEFFYYVQNELSHAHISITVGGTEVACGDFHITDAFFGAV